MLFLRQISNPIVFFLARFAPTRPSVFGFKKRIITFNRKPLFALSTLFLSINDKFLTMKATMLKLRLAYKKIVKTVIKFITVNMVDYFGFQKFTTKTFFKNISMRLVRFAIYCKSSISHNGNTANFSFGRNRIAIVPTLITIVCITITFCVVFVGTTLNFTFIHTNNIRSMV